jgi:two-component system, OmpR family, sensor histidine kinase KdpD
MNEEDRPNPVDLLESIKKEESKRTKGHLKIFLGMAAGVGKTYAMLESAQKLRKEGINVVVGTINTHGREETAKLLEGLQVIPEKWIKYKDTVFEELDLDAILKSKPQLVLVDELAHSNIPGSRHPKRWQDVLEILDNGINVYTTLNVQHIESLKDVIEKVTGITIRETVPDLVIDQADSIELIDLTPDDLLIRLKEGKVYLGDQSIIAARNFFQEDKLAALREIVLRYAAEKVEHDLQEMVSSVERPDSWKLREKLLVAISPSPHSQKLIRITRRLAFNLDAPWIAVHVDTGRFLNKEEEETLAKNLALARDLGAEVITTTGPDLAQAVQRIARQKSVTQIVIGRAPANWFLDYFRPTSLMDHLARECSDIDLHVIRQTLYSKSYGRRWRWPRLTDPISSYLMVTCCVVLLSVFSWFFHSMFSYEVVGFVFLLGILFLSLFFRKGPIFLASILYGLVWVIFFLPEHNFQKQDIVLLGLYLLTAIVTGILTDRARKHKQMFEKRERSLESLYRIAEEIASASSLQEVVAVVKNDLGHAIEGHYEIFVKDIDDGLVYDESIPIAKNEKEKAALNWVYQNGKEAGWSTSTLPVAQNLYIPLKGSKETLGVLAYQPKTDKELSIEEKNFLYTVTHQLSNYIEHTFLEEKAHRYEQHRELERTYESILNLISNLFEGPLMNIQDAVKELKKIEFADQMMEKETYVERIYVSSDSLARILENISAMVNMNAGLTPVHRTIQDLKELTTLCTSRLKKTLPSYKWDLSADERLPLIPFDYELIELLFYNLAFHTVEFAPPESTVEIELRSVGDYVMLSISGEGQSIPPDMVDAVFEKFYRVSGTTGLGLGLAIAKTIADVHYGELKIKNRPQGGMIFSLYLPIS